MLKIDEGIIQHRSWLPKHLWSNERTQTNASLNWGQYFTLSFRREGYSIQSTGQGWGWAALQGEVLGAPFHFEERNESTAPVPKSGPSRDGQNHHKLMILKSESNHLYKGDLKSKSKSFLKWWFENQNQNYIENQMIFNVMIFNVMIQSNDFQCVKIKWFSMCENQMIFNVF